MRKNALGIMFMRGKMPQKAFVRHRHNGYTQNVYQCLAEWQSTTQRG